MAYYSDLPPQTALKATTVLNNGIHQIYKRFIGDCKDNNCKLPPVYAFAASFYEFSAHTNTMDEPHLALEPFVYAIDLWLFSCSIIHLREYITCVCIYIAQTRILSVDTTILDSANASIYSYTLRPTELENQTYDNHVCASMPISLIEEEIDIANQLYTMSFSPVSDLETKAYHIIEAEELEPSLPFNAKSYAEIVSVI